jgi:autonomous glycyl radical cofactor GrcA
VCVFTKNHNKFVLGLYWFLNRNGTELTAVISQTGYQDGQSVYQDSGESNGAESKSNIIDTAATKQNILLHENTSNQKDDKGEDKMLMEKVSFNQESVVSRLCNPLHTIKANEESEKTNPLCV